MESSASRKAEGWFRDDSSCALDQCFNCFQGFDLNDGKRGACHLTDIRLQAEVHVPRHRAGIARAKVRHRKAKHVSVKRLCRSQGSDWKFDETDSISHSAASLPMRAAWATADND